MSMNGSHTLALGTFIALLLAIGAVSANANAGALRDEVSIDLASEIDKVAGNPERFAVEVPYRVSLQSHGAWTATGNARTWRYQVTVPGAVSLSFHASRVVLPSGAALSVSGGGSEYRYVSRDVHRGDVEDDHQAEVVAGADQVGEAGQFVERAGGIEGVAGVELVVGLVGHGLIS